MLKVLLTDTHFGVKQNSLTWLNSQKQFIYEQFIPYLKRLKEPFEILHLGDVFDSRSSISTLIATEVVKIFKDLSNIPNLNRILIIAGNHDFYSPNSDEIDSINLLLSNIDKIEIISKDIKIENQYLFVPWYKWFDQDNLQKVCDEQNIQYVFTHADIISSPVNLVGPKIFSGHTHTIYIKGNIYNLGSCFPLNFTDSNTVRGFYVLYDDGKLKFINNEKSIRFWRLNEESLSNLPDIRDWDYVEIYIKQSNLGNSEYMDIINDIMTNRCKNVSIFPQMTEMAGMKMANFEQYDIESFTASFIPNELSEKFNQILKNKDLNT